MQNKTHQRVAPGMAVLELPGASPAVGLPLVCGACRRHAQVSCSAEEIATHYVHAEACAANRSTAPVNAQRFLRNHKHARPAWEPAACGFTAQSSGREEENEHPRVLM